VKLALSRKNIWERVPRPLKTVLGAVLRAVPQQRLLGKSFRKHLSFIEQAQWWSAEQNREYQLAELRRICALAYEKTGYYRCSFDRIGFTPKDLRSLDDVRRLPTIDRTTLGEHLHEMWTTPPHASNIDYTSTGGTSGMPLGFYIGANRSQIEYAYLTSSWQRVGFKLGLPLAVFRGRPVAKDNSGLYHEYDPLLRYHCYSNFHMTDANMRRYIEHVRSIGPCFMHVYPSSATTLARFLVRSGTEPPANIQGIIAESEIVYPEQHRLIEAVFKRRLFACYGLTEKVVAAAECEYASTYHVWPTYGFFELLDDAGNPVTKPGHRGEIVGTGFINSIVPFVRYRTGDYATYVADFCGQCRRAHPLITNIRGHRIQENLVTSDGASITWTALNMHDDTFTNVQQFQFYQDTPGRAVLRIVPTRSYTDSDRQRIAHRLQQKFDQRLRLDFEVVETIALSRSGKAIYVDQHIPDISHETWSLS
jgi:phenylacetate-CoA ligase